MAATQSLHHAAPFGVSASRASEGLFERLANAFRQMLLVSRTQNELSQLTPAQLRDIGLEGQDLASVSRKLVYGER